MADGDGLALQIDGAPSQPQHLASAQTVIGGNLHAQFKGIAFHRIKQLQHFFLTVESAMINVFLRPVYFVGGIFGDGILPDCALQSFSDDCVVMYHGICRASVCQHLLIKIFNVLRCQIHHRNSARFEVGDNAGLEHIGIALVCCGGDRRAHTIQPLVHVVRELQPCIMGNSLLQNALLFLTLQLLLVLFFKLASDLIKRPFCLALTGSGHGQFG